MIPAFRAELLKLRRRPGVLILLAAMFGTVVLLGYAVLYVVATQAPADELQGLDPGLLLAALQPASMPGQVLGIVAGPGVAIAVILGALVIGAEYGWRTVKTMTTQEPQRLPLHAGRVLAVGLVCVVLAAVAFAGGALGAAIVAALEPTGGTWPSVAEGAGAFGVALLALAVWCAIGMCLAMLFRGTAWAVGIGLLYALAVESIVGLLPLRGDVGDLLARSLISNNITALVADAAPDTTGAFGAPTVPIPPAQAVAVLVAYLAVALVVAAVVFARRDIAD